MCRWQGIDQHESWLQFVDLGSHLRHSLWTPELESALEEFSLSAYLDWLDHFTIDDRLWMYFDFPEAFLNYLK